jgi:type II secretory pathway component PulF
MDPLGLGLTGTSGAIIFCVTSFGILFAMVGIANGIANDETLKSKALGIAMNIPGLAGCVRAFALQRFSLAYRFMAESGVKADRTIAVALRATANKAYREHEQTAAKKVRKGREVTEVLAECGTKLFPEDYQEAARVGEETGQLAEVMEKQARHYQEESERKMNVVTKFAGLAVYGFIAMLMIMAIFKLYSGVMDPYSNPDLKALEKMAGYG